MKIKKNGQVIRLTESDIKRIVKRTLNEASYEELSGTNTQLPGKCSENELETIMNAMSERNNLKVKIQTGADAGIGGSIGREILVITDPRGDKCGCTKEEFFAGGI